MSEHPISDLVSSAMQSIREMVDVNTIVGTPIETTDGTTIIPVSRVSFGFGAGGSEFEPKKALEGKEGLFGGGSGAGVSINPVGFLVVSSGDVKMIPVVNEQGALEKLVEYIPGAVDKITEMIKKKKNKVEQEEE